MCHGQLLRLCSRAWELRPTELGHPEPVLGNKRNPHGEQPARCKEERAPLVTARERDPHKQKLKNIKIITIVFVLTFLFCSLK